MTGSAFGLFGALAVTVGLLLIAMYLLRRMRGDAVLRGGRGVPLRILQRVSVGPKQGVALLQVGERVLVVSIAEAGTQLLTEIADPAVLATLRPAVSESGRGAAARTFEFKLPALPKLFALLALLVLPVAAHAQSPASATASPSVQARAAAVQLPATRPPATGSSSRLVVRPPAPPQVELKLGEGSEQLHLSGAVGIVVFLGALTLLPAMFLLMTSFTRILIVLHFLRSAIGTQTTPPSQLLVAIAVLLTGVVMNPVLQQTNETAIQPYFAGQISQAEGYSRAIKPFREFMLANTRRQDLTLFTDLSRVRDAKTIDDVPTVTVISAFVTSELRTAFQMGFVIFLPFVVIDVIVASVLMSLGMFMLPPMMISLPFKLLLFVLADGWTLVVQNLVASFR